MKLYIQSNDGILPSDHNMYAAWEGFHDMGYDPILFKSLSELSATSPSDVVVGGIGMVESHLRNLGVTLMNMDYPAQLSAYLDRSVWKTTADEVAASSSWWPVFLKPLFRK